MPVIPNVESQVSADRTCAVPRIPHRDLVNAPPNSHHADAPHPQQIEAWRAMGASRRSELAADLRRQARSWKHSALRAQHPTWPEAQVGRELARIYRRGNT